MRVLPAMLSISEMAILLGLNRHVIRDKCDSGMIPTFTLGPKDAKGRQKRWISLAALREHFPELWDAVQMKADAYEATVGDDDDD